MAALDALATTGADHDAAKGGAVQATSDRDEASDALGAWMKQFRAIAKVALRSQPALAKKLKL